MGTGLHEGGETGAEHLSCSIEGCAAHAIYRTRRLCKRHYWEVAYAVGLVAPRLSREQQFWAKVSPEPNTGCWLWTGSYARGGYGQFGNGKRAHRVAWEYARGSIPLGLFVCHRCDNPTCCNPEHLFLGTHLDNEQDKDAKDRRPRGAETVLAKLTDEEVLSIRREYASSRIRQRDLARKYGVGQASIHYIVTGKHWAHLGEIPPRRSMGPPRTSARILRTR